MLIRKIDREAMCTFAKRKPRVKSSIGSTPISSANGKEKNAQQSNEI